MILLTGGAGYVGSHIALALSDLRMPVTVLDDLSTGQPWLVPPCVPLVRGDIADRQLVAKTIRQSGADTLIHCAGVVSVVESMADPLRYYRINVASAIDLIGACLEVGLKRIIFSSTATVYGEPAEPTLAETLPLLPVNPYAASKAMVERILQDLAAAGRLQYGILRYFNVAGADPAGRSGQGSLVATHLIKIAAEAAVGKRDHVDVTGIDYDTADGTGVRDYIHVSDLADAHVAAVRALREGHDSFIVNIGYGRGHSVLEVLDAVDRVSGRSIPRQQRPRRPGDVARLVADPLRAGAILGWRPVRGDLDQMVADAIAWERLLERLKPQ